MNLLLAISYLIPFLFLGIFIGRIQKKFILFILWGILAAIPVYLIEPFLFSAVQDSIPLSLAPLTISPIVEEFFKALPLIILALVAGHQSDRDIFLYAMASGIGFAVIETGLTLPPSFALVLTHSFSTALMHGCTCGIIGYGIVLIGNSSRRILPTLLFGFYTLAVTVHALYNTLGSAVFGLTGFLIDLVFPFVLFLILLLCYHIDMPAIFSRNKPAAG
ncbi:MAG: PrsW family intramembrane metalloprotease [Methanoregula sp.]|nr:PrsW family intramembrane metalloprotease [Methanoregula sp.]